MGYSEELKAYEGEVPLSIKEAIEEINIFFSTKEVQILQYDEYSIAISVNFTVPLPPRGPIGGIDIREKEPCLIKISLKNYPHECPFILSDRKDFPRMFLGHLYVPKQEGKPGGFCLVRNDPHEWFSNKRLTDLLVVAEQWLFKAGIGRLNEDGNEFDPTRLESYKGYHIYRYDMMHEVVSENQRLLPGHAFSLLLSCVYTDKDDLTYKSTGPIQYVQLEDAKAVITKSWKESGKEDKAKLLFSLWCGGMMMASKSNTVQHFHVRIVN